MFIALALGIDVRLNKLESKIASIPQITVTNITNNIEKTVTWCDHIQTIPSVPMPYNRTWTTNAPYPFYYGTTVQN